MVGAPTRPGFTLTDHFRQPVLDSDFHGRFQLVYFGFTSCRVVCPRALTKLSMVLDAIGDDADRIVALYISVDPDRDTPEVMRRYLDTDYPRFTGLTGPAEAIDAARRDFRVFAERRRDPSDPEGYTVSHTAIAFLIDPSGRYLDHFSDALDADVIIDRLRTHLQVVRPQRR